MHVVFFSLLHRLLHLWALRFERFPFSCLFAVVVVAVCSFFCLWCCCSSMNLCLSIFLLRLFLYVCIVDFSNLFVFLHFVRFVRKIIMKNLTKKETLMLACVWWLSLFAFIFYFSGSIGMSSRKREKITGISFYIVCRIKESISCMHQLFRFEMFETYNNKSVFGSARVFSMRMFVFLILILLSRLLIAKQAENWMKNEEEGRRNADEHIFWETNRVKHLMSLWIVWWLCLAHSHFIFFSVFVLPTFLLAIVYFSSAKILRSRVVKPSITTAHIDEASLFHIFNSHHIFLLILYQG